MKKIDEKVINSIRFLSVDAIEKANSGHPGLPMGAAPMAYTLWSQFLKGSGKNPTWPNRDRFVLSAGHGSMLLYSLLHLFEYGLSIEDLKNFRQWDSKTPGHPEYGHTEGVETTTGPLGQGLGNAVGMAMAERRLAAQFNTEDYTMVDHYTYVIAGDGDMMEGVTSEAASLAGHLKLGKLITLYDDNNITIDGNTEMAFTEDVGKRFESYGWQVLKVSDGNDIEQIANAIKEAKEEDNKPSLIMVKTVIGYGSPNKAGTSKAHGSPLGKEEVTLTKEGLSWDDHSDFHVPEDVREHMKAIVEEKEKEMKDWEKTFEEYKQAYPKKANEWEEWNSLEVSKELVEDKELWDFGDKAVATRSAGGTVMNIIKKYVPNLVGGSADLNASTKTYLKDMGDFSNESAKGNNIFFGVREHAMGAIINGISLHGGFRVFGSTFLVFSDYMKPSIRLAALMKQPVIYVFTHDSIGVGEDGPTHQPIEHVMALRSIPNLNVFRPADAKETAVSWLEALADTDTPSALILTRQNLPILEGVHKAAHMGGYILKKEDKENPDVILIGTGSEVSLLVDAHKELKKEGIEARVVSIISWELFDSQPESYKKDVLPPNVTKRISVEAGITLGWQKYVGTEGKVLGIDQFGASGPGPVLMDRFGFTVENIVKEVKEMI